MAVKSYLDRKGVNVVVTGIAAQASVMKYQEVRQEAAVKTMKTAMDSAEQQGDMLGKLLDTIPSGQDPTRGTSIDVHA